MNSPAGKGLTVKLTLLDVTGPDPVPGLSTVTARVPAVATLASGTVADKVVLLRKLVVRAVPFN